MTERENVTQIREECGDTKIARRREERVETRDQRELEQKQ